MKNKKFTTRLKYKSWTNPHTTHEELLVFQQAPPQVVERGRLTRYGGHWGNKIPRVDQNQHHCLVVKGDLQRLGEETPTENQLAQRLRWQPHH